MTNETGVLQGSTKSLLEDEGSLLLSLVGAEQGAGRTQLSLDES